MNLIDHITSALHTAATSISTAWHDHVAPWLSDFLKNTAKAEVEAVLPLATGFVQEALPALVKAAASGDFSGYADAQWDAIVNTANAAKAASITVGINSVSTAVTALISGHPDVVAASVPPASPASPASPAP